MHKKWLQVLLLCVAYAIYLHGNCAAETNVDNWVKWYEDHHRILFVNENFVNVREYNGRKYLELATKINTTIKPQNKEYISRIPPLSVLFDVERNTSIQLVTDSKIQAIELTKTGSLPLEYQALLRWAERKYPTLINELREHNRNHPLQIEVSNAPIAGSETQTVTANGDYGFVRTLGDGPVQYAARMIRTPLTHPVLNDGITRSYVGGVPATGLRCQDDELVPAVVPDNSKPLYIIYRSDYRSNLSNVNQFSNWIYAIFSYDDETNTFTLYRFDHFDPRNRLYAFKTIHVVDNNNIVEDYLDDSRSYEGEKAHFTYEYRKSDWLPDADGNSWERTDDFPVGQSKRYGELIECLPVTPPIGESHDTYYNEIGLDGLFVFLSRKGNVGYAPPSSSAVEYVDQMDYEAATVAYADRDMR